MPSGYNWCLLVARWSIRDRRVSFIIRSLTSCGFHSSWDRVSNRICGNTAGKLCAVNCVRRFRPFFVVCMYCGISQGILASSQSEDMQKKMKMGGWINDHLKNEEQTPFNHVVDIDVAKFVYQGAFCNLAYMCLLATHVCHKHKYQEWKQKLVTSTICITIIMLVQYRLCNWPIMLSQHSVSISQYVS